MGSSAVGYWTIVWDVLWEQARINTGVNIEILEKILETKWGLPPEDEGLLKKLAGPYGKTIAKAIIIKRGIG